MHTLIFTIFFLIFARTTWAQQGTTCSALSPCISGCCSQYGSCGFGPQFCGTGCQGTCGAVAECGQYAPSNSTTCPLNVCCSQYGFCGTTSDFCGTGCQNGCFPVVEPSCSSDTNAMDLSRRIAYYELWSATRDCDAFQPENIAAASLTHVYIAFATLDTNFNIIDVSGDLVARVSRLKKSYIGLRVTISIGGWAFNDPPTQNIFSDMASTVANRATFISSLISYMQKYGLDGVDIDWEYPAAPDRGGVPLDTTNYVDLMSEIREQFDSINPGWEATITLPSSYWYLRGFDVNGLQKYVSWFNVLTYDIHGVWDQYNLYTGPYLLGHTNLTEIAAGLDLLWHNGIDPTNVVMGFAFYGRSFTMTDPSCYEPGCTFSAAGIAGDCTQTAGILSYAEVVSRNQSLNTNTYYDPVSTVKYTTYGGNQWISYDDEQSFTDKKAFLSSHCISGLMIWAIDQDTLDYQALAGLLGDSALSNSLITGGEPDAAEMAALASAFAAYNGQNCFVTKVCTDGTQGQKGPDQVCPAGYTSVSTAHSPIQAPGLPIQGACSTGWYRYICCPTNAMPQNCEWNGAPQRSEFGCSGGCGSTQFLLNTDTYLDAFGDGQCFTGTRDLCCDSTEILEECSWTACQGPLDGPPSCPSGTTLSTYRYDNDDGSLCNPNVPQSFYRAFCCPSSNPYKNCDWSNNPNPAPGQIVPYDPETICKPSQCPSGQVQITDAQDPPNGPEFSGAVNIGSAVDCAAYPLSPGQSPWFPYCCDPPSQYNNNWPVDPSYLWSNYYDAAGDAVQWSYADNYGNNGAESGPSDTTGDDPYGFVMLDGPPGSLDNDFGSSFTITRRSEELPMIKRSLLTTNKTVLDATFDHAEETIYVYCNYPKDSPKCTKIFYTGAEDTIVRLPDHVGEGPFARIVSMQLAPRDYKLPEHHIRARTADGNSNNVYKVVFDYNFHLIKRTDAVNMRVDYTNLLSYWGEVTDTPASRKRSVTDEHLEYRDWRSKVDKAKEVHRNLKSKRSKTSKRSAFDSASVAESEANSPTHLGKRWFGIFTDWLKRLTTVETKDVGYLTMAFAKSILLYHAQVGCSQSTAMATLDITLDANIAMDATYAYYFSGTIVPPGITGTYAYFGLEPSAYLALTITGNAQLQYTSDRRKLVDTLAYPGLSVKGIASVGPTLDVYGQIRGVLQIAGQMQVGAEFSFGKAEVYWPEEAVDTSVIQDLVGQPEAIPTGIVPTFSASVQASADLDILVTPEANMGIRVGGGGGIFGTTLVDAQIVGFVNSTLRFHAEAAASTSSGGGSSASYSYGVYLLYNLGYGGYATIPFYSWNANPRNLFSMPKSIPLYENGDVVSSSATKRSIEVAPKIPRRGLLNSRYGEELESPADFSYSIPGNGSSLFRRQCASCGDTGEDSTFSLATLFQCPPGGGCPSDLIMKRDELSGRQTPAVNCPMVLPELRYACNAWFGNTQISGPTGQTEIVPGICQNVAAFFTARSLTNSGLTLTFDSDSGRSNTRRTASCGQQFCVPANINLENSVGVPAVSGGYVSCDEFPFASVEEGGLWFGNVQYTATGAQVLCVPVWQQTLQGKCNSLLSNVQTNVAYYDNPTAAANWQSWSPGNNAWVTPQANGFGRTTIYPNPIPNAQGIPATAWAASGQMLGYQFKRNFTMGLAYPQNPTDGGAWGTQAFTSARAATGTITDATAIACAVNIHGNSNYYQYTAGTYNGWCYTGVLNNPQGVYQAPGYQQCKVSFSNSPGPAKRSLGMWGEYNITDIEISTDPETLIEVPADFQPGGPLLPARFSDTSPAKGV